LGYRPSRASGHSSIHATAARAFHGVRRASGGRFTGEFPVLIRYHRAANQVDDTGRRRMELLVATHNRGKLGEFQ